MPAKSPINLHTSQVLVGSGELYVALLDDDGNLPAGGGERFIGDTTAFTLNVEEERTVVYSGDGPVATKLIDRVIRKNFSATVTVQDMSADNLALLLSGETTSAAAANAAAAKSVVGPLAADRWYPLGVDATHPLGVLDAAVTGVKKGAAKAGPFNALAGGEGEGEGYEWDARGRILALAPLAGQWLEVSYTTSQSPHAGAKTSAATKDLLAQVTYLEDSADAGGKNILIPRCSIGASGDTAIKADRSASQQITLTLGIQQPPGGGGQIYFDGKAL